MQPSRSNYTSLATEVRRAQAGNLRAFRNLVVRFQDMAVGYALSLLGDYHLAEDAAQEAFVSWLRTVVFKRCDRIRRRRPITGSLAADDERLVADDPEPADVFAQGEVSRLVGHAIASLPRGQREVVSLYYIGEQSGREVASFLDLPLSTVKKRFARLQTQTEKEDVLHDQAVPEKQPTLAGCRIR